MSAEELKLGVVLNEDIRNALISDIEELVGDDDGFHTFEVLTDLIGWLLADYEKFCEQAGLEHDMKLLTRCIIKSAKEKYILHSLINAEGKVLN